MKQQGLPKAEPLDSGRPNSLMHGSASRRQAAPRRSQAAERSARGRQTFQHHQGRPVQRGSLRWRAPCRLRRPRSPSSAVSWMNRGADKHRTGLAGVGAASYTGRRWCAAPAGQPATLRTSWSVPHPGAVELVERRRSVSACLALTCRCACLLVCSQ